MEYHVQQAAAVLGRTPLALRGLLGGLGDSWCLSNYGEGTFSPFDVVGHLIEADETNWLTRVRFILERGEAAPIPAFDRYAMIEKNRGRSMEELLERFAVVRGKKVLELLGLGLTEEALGRRGVHPQLGVVTVRQVLAAWVVHDLGHTHQIAKSMAWQYRAAVGPFAELLTILPRG